MILPLGDEPNPRGLPVVTYALMLINCAAYLFVSLPLSFVGPEPGDPVVLEYLGAIEESMARLAGLAPLFKDCGSMTCSFLNGGFVLQLLKR